MKKLLSLILVLTLVLSMGMVAFAETDSAGNTLGNQNDGDWTEVKFKKSVETIGNTGAKNPAETYNFTITPVSGLNEQNVAITAPAFSPATFSIPVAEGANEAIGTVPLPTFTSVGTYVYQVQESFSNTAGMVYDTANYTFTVVVLNVNADGTGGLKRLILADSTGKKTDVFMNKYKAGSLTVNKTITGNNAKFNETFPVKVTLTGPASKLIKSTITVAGNVGSVVQTGNGGNEVVITFDVTNGSNVVISNIPAGVTYKVEETDLKNYTPTYTGETGTIVVNENKDTTIVNDLSRDIATGISFDNLPYILLLAGAALGLGALIVRKRKNAEY